MYGPIHLEPTERGCIVVCRVQGNMELTVNASQMERIDKRLTDRKTCRPRPLQYNSRVAYERNRNEDRM